ncbi:MAG: FHA domain-containing protein [Anaerolineae bacterium]|nr:FHA domain-containing protein [Anaerolineae bacterium]MDW8172982.1 FHA domain-containing protein [Anaerolineae bacterium]
MITCSNCGAQNRDEEQICIKCGSLLVEVNKQKTRSLGDTDYEEGTPRWGAARFDSTMSLVITVLANGKEFVFNAENIERLTIGRTDPDTGESPPINLDDCDARNLGVSRYHAFIVRLEGALHLVDNNSANGTYLNGQKLVANQPRILRDGDDIRLGHLVVRVSFRAR